MNQSRPGVRVVAIGVALAAGMLLASCGSSGTADPSSTPTGAHTHSAQPETPPASDTPGAGASTAAPGPSTGSDAQTPSGPASEPHAATDIAGACAALVRLDAVPQPGHGPDAPSAEENKQFGQAALPLVTEAMGKGDDQLAESLAVLKPIAEAAANQGTPIPDDETVMAALAGYHGWAHSRCGFQNVDVTAIDYQYQGFPATLKAGPTSIAMKNASTKGEFHVALIVRPKDPAVATVEQLLAIPLPELESAVDMIGSAAAPPGANGGVLLDLKPGRYFMVCPVPIGGDEQSGDMHMTHGMAVAFEVA